MLLKATYDAYAFETGDEDFDKANASQLKITKEELVAAANKHGQLSVMFKGILDERKRQQDELVARLT